jgi:exosortase
MGTQSVTAGPGRTARNLSIFAICLPVVLLLWPAVKTAAHMAFSDDRYLQILLAPVVCLLLMFLERNRIFLQVQYSPRIGIPLLSLAVPLVIACAFGLPTGNSRALPLAMLAIALVWLATFVLFYGIESFRAACYPWCCLLLMIPLPHPWMDQIASGSAAVSYQILRVLGVPVLRHGFRFSLPGFDFEVAPECSGIRSSLALLVVAIVAGYVCLRSGWARLALVLATIPIAIFKNAVRISVLSVLSTYVDRIFVDGPIHHTYGGLLFSIVGVVLFVLVLVGLQRMERPRTHQSPAT